MMDNSTGGETAWVCGGAMEAEVGAKGKWEVEVGIEVDIEVEVEVEEEDTAKFFSNHKVKSFRRAEAGQLGWKDELNCHIGEPHLIFVIFAICYTWYLPYLIFVILVSHITWYLWPCSSSCCTISWLSWFGRWLIVLLSFTRMIIVKIYLFQALLTLAGQRTASQVKSTAIPK